MDTTEYRTTVETADDQDEHPGMIAHVDEDGGLTILTPDMVVETHYGPEEWTTVLCEAPIR